MSMDRDNIIKLLRTVRHYFVTEKRRRNCDVVRKICVYDGENGNGVGCAVGCCLTYQQAKQADRDSIGTLAYTNSTTLADIYVPMGIKHNPANRRTLVELQQCHDEPSNESGTLDMRMNKVINKICHRRRIPRELLELSAGPMYTK